MNEKEVHNLLKRYFDGVTSLDEERKLQHYFADEVPDSLKQFRPLFAFFAKEQTVQPPSRTYPASTPRPYWAILTGIAASITILLITGLPKMQPDSYAYYVDGQRVYDESAAVASAGDKLQMLAASMQKARSSMAAFGKLQESNLPLQQFDKISAAYRKVEKLKIEY